MSKTDEEKVALAIIKLTSDIHLDLTMTGHYFATLGTKGDLLRLEEIRSSADSTVEKANSRHAHWEHLVTTDRD